ncbi:hypothetical protein A2Y47_00445 [Candidatus Giovannonibacteria bacterium RIFCSPLOWO2_12_43_8]|uniref:Type IV pilus assembly protein PilM n=2 Tax=Candidatus Giovannoniibacteriota TaxID=1752738 RepID=A0A0G1IT45_9BACT|nr:MAG: Type IV pilus assembly protein PilM [Candidatus Giovannonibacteria bacterium GW2011_GWA2_44_26]OGF94162.1 MAG: hypothetical protein A2Y47_00445 [Candidatus Giovannonibacteria bacterium RIFCSPLOWO2_12_43_8]
MRLPNLSRFFPVPKYIEPSILGLDISDRSLKFAELVLKDGHLELEKFGSRVIPEGLIKSGEIINKDALIEYLKSNLGEFEGREIALSLPEEKVFVALVTMPPMPGANVHEALELQLEEHIPLAAADAIFDFELVPQSADSKDHLDVILVAMPKKLIEDYRNIVRAIGLRPYVFEMETQALVRSIVPKDEEGTVMIMDFGRTRTSFAIVSGGMIRFTSTVSVAGESLDASLAKVFNVDLFSAERLKKERGFVRTKENQEVFNALLPVVSAVKEEVFRHLIFWQNHAQHAHYSKSEISKLYLCGGESNLTGLSEYLSYDLKLPVEIANPWVNITSFDKYIPAINANESLSYATALGLALRSSKFL